MDTSKIIETSKQLYQDIKCIKEARENQMKVNPIPSSYTKILELRENVFLHQLGLRIWTERARKCWNLQYYSIGHIKYIRGFEDAYKDNFIGWECHHIMETKYPMHITSDFLKELGIYWNIPTRYLIFMKLSEHRDLHKTNKATTERYERWMYGSYLVGEEITDPSSDFPSTVFARDYKRVYRQHKESDIDTEDLF